MICKELCRHAGGSAPERHFNGSGTLLASIAAPGSRTWSFTMTSTDLTQISDPDAKTR